MTINRNKQADVQKTKEMIGKNSEGKSWLGHGGGAGKIDWMLANGCTYAEMEKARGGVDNHLYHLKTEHGLNITKINGVYRFDL